MASRKKSINVRDKNGIVHRNICVFPKYLSNNT